jgi:hypothetical protein
MDDHLTALQFARTIEKEIQLQTKWLADIDLSGARPIPPEEIYRSSSLTQQPFDASGVNPSVSCKKQATREQFVRARNNFGFVYPSTAELRGSKDSRPPQTIYGATFPHMNSVYIPSVRYPNGQALKRDTYREHGAFHAVLDRH